MNSVLQPLRSSDSFIVFIYKKIRTKKMVGEIEQKIFHKIGARDRFSKLLIWALRIGKKDKNGTSH